MFRIIMMVLFLLVGINVNSSAEARSCKRPPLSLKGTTASMEYQNCMGDKFDWSRIQDDRQLRRFVRAGLLVPLPQNKYVRIDGRLEQGLRYVRPMTRRFILEISQAFYAEFGKPLWVNSAARTMDHQRKLQEENSNAARGDRSPHLRGGTIDFGKKKLTKKQKAWLRKRLLKNEKVGRAESTEEKRQAVFHIMPLK